MSDIKNEIRKNTTSFISLGIIIAVIIFFALNKFIFTGDGEFNLSALLGSKNAVQAQKIQVKRLDINIFEDDKFKKLKEKKARISDIKELDIGRDNPFIRN